MMRTPHLVIHAGPLCAPVPIVVFEFLAGCPLSCKPCVIPGVRAGAAGSRRAERPAGGWWVGKKKERLRPRCLSHAVKWRRALDLREGWGFRFHVPDVHSTCEGAGCDCGFCAQVSAHTVTPVPAKARAPGLHRGGGVGGREHSTLVRETAPLRFESPPELQRCRVTHNLPHVSPVGINQEAHRQEVSRIPLGLEPRTAELPICIPMVPHYAQYPYGDKRKCMHFTDTGCRILSILRNKTFRISRL